MKKVAVIIVNWNGRRFLENCLNSLSAQTYHPIKIYFVDNGSDDTSVAFVEKAYSHVTLIRNSSNLGFAEANNQGIKAALADPEISHIALLNNDTEVDPDWLNSLLQGMQTDTTIGVAASKIYNFTQRDIIDSVGDSFSRTTGRVRNRGHNERDEGQYELFEEVFAACAAACLIRRETLEDICMDGSYFDTDFGSYIEDVDLCIRARLAGWTCWYVPTARVYHVGSGTSSRLVRTWKYSISQRNRIFTVIKNMPFPYVVVLLFHYLIPIRDAAYVALKLFPFLRRFRTNPAAPIESSLSIQDVGYVYVQGTLGALRLLPKMLKKRRIIQRSRVISNNEVRRWFRELAL